jgi:hypothetical protein
MKNKKGGENYMKLKVLLLLFLLTFASMITLTTVVFNAIITPNQLGTVLLTSFNSLEPAGGEQIDNPKAPS